MIRGRKPLPTVLHVLHGNPGKRALPTEPKFRDGTVSCPRELDKEARKEWRRVLKEYKNTPGLLKPMDRGALAVYCALWSQFVKLTLRVEAEGLIVEDDEGRSRINPSQKALQQVITQLRKYLPEFGMTPSSRVRLGTKDDLPATGTKPHDPVKEKLFGHRARGA